jgi:hypothetical protein
MSPSRISFLSAAIAEHASTIEDFLAEKKLPSPSFEEDALWSLPIPDDAKDVKAARVALIEACSELQDLVTGPKNILNINVRACADESTFFPSC